MDKIKINIQMDQDFYWWPMTEEDLAAAKWKNEKARLLVDSSVVDRYNSIATEFYELQAMLEELWRAQEGKSFDKHVVPDFQLLEK